MSHKDDSPLARKRHSLSHLMTMAVVELYPEAGLGVGPATDDGFYQDYELPESVSEEIFPKLEKRMRELIKENIAFVQHDMDPDEAVKEYAHDPYKAELIHDLVERGEKTVSFYKSGDFENLCAGPHVVSTKEIDPKSFKLTRLAGAYWRGDENNKMLTRIYGVAFDTKKELDDYLAMLEEAKKRDHRKLGQELDLFAFSDLVGSGLPLFTPKGTTVRHLLEDFVWSLMKPYGYERVNIPHIAKSDLYKTSGHWDKFADDIFHVHSKKTDTEFVVKPMNCPHHTQIYASRPRSYRDLPLRLSEVTTVYRDENTGQLQGLSRVRSITQDDAHVFCLPEQVEDECRSIYEIIKDFYARFDMPLEARLSLSDPEHPEKYLGGKEIWDQSEGTLRKLLGEFGLSYEEAPGEAAFYGPKIDFSAKDAIGRHWQLATIQIDFNQPERFGLEYVDSDGEKKQPVMIHRAISGSLERFMSVLIEHYAGAFPLWLAPVQVVFASVGEKHVAHVKELVQELKALGVRAEADVSDDTIGAKVRKAAQQKIPWTIVVGDKEVGGGDFQVNVFGVDEKLILSKEELIKQALGA